MNMPLMLDILFALIVLISVAIGARRGAIRAISGVAGTVAGIIGAMKLQGVAAPLVAKVISPIVRASVERAAEARGLSRILDSQMTHDLLQGAQQLMEALGMGGETALAIRQEAAAMGTRVVDAITDGLVGQLAPAIALLLLFLVIKVAVGLVLGLLSWEKLPVISRLNKGLGAILGLISGVVLVGIVCWGLLRFAPESGDSLTRQHVHSSAVGSALTRILGEGD